MTDNNLILRKADKNAGCQKRQHNNINKCKNNALQKYTNEFNNTLKTTLPTLQKFNETVNTLKEKNPQIPKSF